MGKRKGRQPGKPLSLPKKILVYGGYLLFVSLLLIVFVTGAGPYDIPTASRSLPDVIAVSQSYGLPLTEEEVEEPVPDEDNAALVVVPIAESITSDEGQYLRVAMSARAPLDETLTTARTIVERTSLRLDEIQTVLEEKQGWFIDKDLELGPNLIFPEIRYLRDTCDIFRCRAYLRATDGDVEGALSDLTSCRKIALHLSKQFMLIGMLSAARIEVETLNATVLIADLWQTDEIALERLRQRSSDSYSPIDPRPAIRQEFFNGVTITRNLSHYGGFMTLFGDSQRLYEEEFVFNSEGLIRAGLPKRMWERATLARFAEIYNAGYGPIKDDPHPPFGWTRPITEKYESFDRVGSANFPPSLSGANAQIMIPVVAQADAALTRADAMQAIAEATIDTLIYRLRTGALPVSLGDLETLYVDPYNGEPLKYRQTAEGFRIWSVNDDGNDDGGVGRSERSSGDWDVVAIYPPKTENPPVHLP